MSEQTTLDLIATRPQHLTTDQDRTGVKPRKELKKDVT